MRVFAILLLLVSSATALTAIAAIEHSPRQPPAPAAGDPLHRALDELLELNVRDGQVYYLALKQDRRKLDAYAASLAEPAVASAFASWSREQQAAFWINAYNAFVLQTVIDRYPIRGSAPQYPPNSIRQISGAFERLPHRAAGRTVTLDQIEKTIVSEFHDPRMYLALGRGAIGSGRLRSEAFTAENLETQLKQVAAEFPTRPECIRIDRTANAVTVTPIVGWHEADFIAAYASSAAPVFKERSPIERAVLAFLEPNLLPTEREFLDKNEFKVSYHEFDWRLNDLTGGPK
jgi:uncharacterized protein DUF547